MKAIATIFFLVFTFYSLSQNSTKVVIEKFNNVPNRLLAVKGDSVSILDSVRNTIIPYQLLVGNYKDAFGLDGELFADINTPFRVLNEKGEMGVYTPAGQLIFDFNYEEVVCFQYYTRNLDSSYYAFSVRHNNQWKLRTMDDQPFGQDVLYDEVIHFMSDYRFRHILVVLKDGKAKFMDIYTRKLYDSLESEDYSNTMLSLTTNRFGMITYSGRQIHPFQYDWMDMVRGEDTVVNVRKNELFGLLSITGRVLIPCEYDHVFAISDPDFYKAKPKYRPYFGKKNDHFELLIYNDSLQRYEVRSEPMFVKWQTNYSPKYDRGKFIVTDRKGKTGPLIKDGNIVWRKKLFLIIEKE